MRQRARRGNAIIEFSLMAPWLILLFIGSMDWGFYAYALIATEAAARVACLYTSTSTTNATDTSDACTYALEQLRRLPNVGNTLSTCASGTAVTATAPVGISATSVTGPDGNTAAQVSVTYLTPVFTPVIMGGSTLVPKQVTITRSVTMRIGS